MSTSTVLSSVESLPPTASIEGLPRVPEHTAKEQGTCQAGLEEKDGKSKLECIFVCLFDLILYVPSTIFQLNRDGSSWVEPVLS